MSNSRIRIPEPMVSVKGRMPPGVIGYAKTKISAASEHAHGRVLQVRIRLAREANPRIRLRARAQATVDVAGVPVRARVSAATMREAVDLLERRLQRRLARPAAHDHDTKSAHRPPAWWLDPSLGGDHDRAQL